MTDVVRPLLLGASHVNAALKDTRFFDLLPEFRSLQVKVKAMHINLQAAGGCTGCKQRRAVSNVFSDFMSIVSALSPDGLIRLKQYLNTTKIMMNVMNPVTRQVELRIL